MFRIYFFMIKFYCIYLSCFYNIYCFFCKFLEQIYNP